MTVVTRRKRQKPAFQQVQPVVVGREGAWPAVVRFANEQLAEFDLSKLDSFSIGHTRITSHSGYCKYPIREKKGSPKFVRGYRITASAHPEPVRYPLTEAIAIGTEQKGVNFFEYVLHPVTFATPDEAMVWVAGHETFHFLRHSKQIPGRNTEPSANRYGLEWLDRWRKTRPAGRRCEG